MNILEFNYRIAKQVISNKIDIIILGTHLEHHNIIGQSCSVCVGEGNSSMCSLIPCLSNKSTLKIKRV